MRMGLRPPLLSFFKTRKTKIIMGHFDKLQASNLEVGRLEKQVDVRPTPNAATAAGAHTITIAEIRNEILRCDPTADRAWTAPTAALAVAGTPNVKVGDCLDFYLINTGTANADEIITISAGSGGTLIGSGAVLTANAVNDAFSSGSGHFRLRFTNVTASSEAYELFRLA